MLQNNISNLRLFDDKYPLKRDTWPQSRTRKDYENLLTPHQPRVTNGSQDVTFSIPEDAIIFDAGMGDGNALAEFKREDTRTIGVTLHEYKQSNEDKLDTICCSPIPHGDNAQKLFSALRGKVHQVFDIYGPCT